MMWCVTMMWSNDHTRRLTLSVNTNICGRSVNLIASIYNWCLCRFIDKLYIMILIFLEILTDICIVCIHMFWPGSMIKWNTALIKKTIVKQTYILIPLIYSCNCCHRCFKYAGTWINASFQRNPHLNTYTLTRVWRYKKWLEIDRFPKSR